MSESPLEVRVSRHFLGWLQDSKLSLAFTTYQTNRLFLIGRKPDGALSVFERNFDRPMGLWASAERLWMSTRWQLWRFDDALPPGETHAGYDRLYVPRQAFTTGDLDIHDVALDREGRVVFVNTAYSCLATISDRWSFAPLWKPPFVSRLAPEDRCHLNGLAMDDGSPAFVTAVSRSDVAAGWRERRHAGGLVIDVRTSEIVAAELSMPHSPRVHGGRLWVLSSGTGELGTVDRATGRFEPVAFFPGYVRGLTFAGDSAIVGLSKPRHDRTFSGLALDDRLREKDAEARCGLWVVDLRSGVVAHWLELEGVVAELYDVQVLPGVARPMALGFKTDEIQRTITIDVAPRPTFQALAGTRSSGGSEPPTETVADGDRSRADAEYAAANVLVKHGKLEQAIARYVQALVIEPSHLKALLNLGTAQARLGRSDAALDCFRRALDVDPGSLLANSNVAAVLESTGDLDGAIRHWELALRSRPGDADLLLKMWLALYHDGRLPEAKHHLERAIRARPDFAEAHNALGAVLTIEERFDEALRHHDEAARLRPDYYEAHLNAGKIHEKASRLEEAKAVYGRASAIRKDPVLSLHAELLCPPVFPSSEALDAYRAHATAVIDELAGRELAIPAASVQSSSAEPPFDWAYHGRDNLDLKRKYAALFESSFPNVPLERVPSPEGPWRIGFVVTPGHEGVFARCMNAIIDRLDRRRFEVALVCSHASYTAIRSAFANPATRHVNLPLRFDLAAAALRAAAFDAIYYWEVGTDATNYFLPFQRLAPVQLTSWGWPDTSGAPELDFHLTSESLAPDGIEARFTEKLVRLSALPASFPRPPVPTGPRPPSHLELPRDAHLYVCAQTLRKLHPDFDALLGGILRRDRRGVAVFVEDKHRIPSELLRARWRDRLPDVADRMIFVPRLSWEDYFRLIASADVSLDPLYFGGSNTTYDALANGVPVVTLPWELPRGRYAAALCRKLDVEECIATTADDYVERALTLAGDSTRRAKVRAKIAESNTTIFADPAAVVELESFLAQALLAARGD